MCVVEFTLSQQENDQKEFLLHLNDKLMFDDLNGIIAKINDLSKTAFPWLIRGKRNYRPIPEAQTKW